MVATEELGNYLSPNQLDLVVRAILATAFGQNQRDKLPPEQAHILYRGYKPETKIEKLLVLADVSNFRWGVQAFLQDNINIGAEFAGPAIAGDFDHFIAVQISFLSYVQKLIVRILA